MPEAPLCHGGGWQISAKGRHSGQCVFGLGWAKLYGYSLSRFRRYDPDSELPRHILTPTAHILAIIATQFPAGSAFFE